MSADTTKAFSNTELLLENPKTPTARRFSRRGMLRSIAAVSLLAQTGCFDEWSGTVTRNIRVIVQAEADGQIHEGSAVMSLHWVPRDDGGMHIESDAEAVILDLPGRGTVYVVNAYITDDSVNGGYWPSAVLRTFNINAHGKESDFPTIRSLTGRHPVEPVFHKNVVHPVMVAFRDETRRETMFQVKPEDFSELFGQDVRYIGMWFEFTEDPPSDHILERLPVGVTPNESFYSAFPSRNAEGDLLTAKEMAFPQKILPTVFFMRKIGCLEEKGHMC